MAWWRFLVWNVAGAVVWATSVALIAYCLGEAVASATAWRAACVVGGLIDPLSRCHRRGRATTFRMKAPMNW